MEPAKTWRLWVSYLGTHFAGFQEQLAQKTIEGAFKQAFEHLIGFAPQITPAGRTDSGVHARGQVISCTFQSRFNTKTLPLALSHLMGPDICVYRAEEMPDVFDARRQAIGKRYVYRISQDSQNSPFNRLYTWHLRQKLDLGAMQKAAEYLVGEHDFESFRSTNCVAEHARRYVWMINMRHCERSEAIYVDIRGNAFCHNMVRIIVGTLVEIGQGKLQADTMPEILEARDRTRAGRTAPPHGLTLEEVYYPDDLLGAEIPAGARFPRYPVTPETWPC